MTLRFVQSDADVMAVTYGRDDCSGRFPMAPNHFGAPGESVLSGVAGAVPPCRF
jgi:hypothetical protein